MKIIDGGSNVEFQPMRADFRIDQDGHVVLDGLATPAALRAAADAGPGLVKVRIDLSRALDDLPDEYAEGTYEITQLDKLIHLMRDQLLGADLAIKDRIRAEVEK